MNNRKQNAENIVSQETVLIVYVGLSNASCSRLLVRKHAAVRVGSERMTRRWRGSDHWRRERVFLAWLISTNHRVAIDSIRTNVLVPDFCGTPHTAMDFDPRPRQRPPPSPVPSDERDGGRAAVWKTARRSAAPPGLTSRRRSCFRSGQRGGRLSSSGTRRYRMHPI